MFLLFLKLFLLHFALMLKLLSLCLLLRQTLILSLLGIMLGISIPCSSASASNSYATSRQVRPSWDVPVMRLWLSWNALCGLLSGVISLMLARLFFCFM
jgi:ABC-type polysaccharide transport system permease subunit